jgi:D-alanyl-D-alanine carboxypeptidase (penicillin-binding protein 5/6)
MMGKILATAVVVTALITLPAFAGSPASRVRPVPPVPPTDIAALVSKGKRPAFFDPNDLSKPPVLSAPCAILVDADTGQVLWSKNADLRRPMASTTKIMTSLLFIEHTRPTDVVTCLDPSVTRIEESSLHIKPWEKFTAENLLYGTICRSANDGAVVMAEHVAGSVPRFAEMMNDRARQIGATNTHFVNPNGLNEHGHYSTAHDLALISCEAMRNPRFADAVSLPTRTIDRTINRGDTRITARSGKIFHAKFPGADGVKSGYTRQAGHCYVGSATRDGRRLLSVVLGAKGSAIGDTIPLLSWGFQRFPAVVVARKDQAVGQVTVKGGVSATVLGLAGADLRATTDALAPETGGVTTEVQPAAVAAPVRRGSVIGAVVAKVGGRVVGQAPVFAAQDVPEAPLSAVAARTTPWIPPAIGGLALLLVGWRYGTASAKSAGRRRHRLAAARRGAYRGG